MRKLLFTVAALFATPAYAAPNPVVEHVVTPGGTYVLDDNDRLLLPGTARNQDANGVAIALPRKNAQGEWPFEYRDGALNKSFKVKDSAALRFRGKKDSLFAYSLPSVSTLTVPSYQFRNGISLSNSRNGYFEDSVRFVSPYIFNGGIRSLRVPYKASAMIANGTVATTITLNGYPTKIAEPFGKIVDLALANDVQVWVDDHEFKPYSDPVVAANNIAVGSWLMNRYGDNDNIVLELSNEAASGSWEANWATNVQNTIAQIRAVGITYKVGVSWGGWNSVGGITRAMTELDAIGGPAALDPLNKVIFTGHHYPTTTGNDMAASGKSAPQIKGATLNTGLVTFFDTCKLRNIQCQITEIGFGGGARGWLSNGTAGSTYNGKAWAVEYMAKQDHYAGNVNGTIMWGGGTAFGITYPFKIEYDKDAWDQTQGTDFWMTVKPFFSK